MIVKVLYEGAPFRLFGRMRNTNRGERLSKEEKNRQVWSDLSPYCNQLIELLFIFRRKRRRARPGKITHI